MAKNKYTDIDLSKYDNGFQNTDAINQAYDKKINSENALENLGNFKFDYSNQAAYDKAMNDILNRKDFSYDLNGDMLYQQYKDNYINQGEMAMMDTMGQASALTGGYGNSYAQTVGQQTYQGYLQGLNDKIPELYQMALDRYNAEGDRLATNYGLLSSDRQNALNEYSTEYNTNLSRLTSDRDYYSNDYDSVYNRDYAVWNDNRTHDTSQYWNEYNAGYKAEQDAIANKLARDQLAEQIRANKASEGISWANYKLNKETKDQSEALAKAQSELRLNKALSSIADKSTFTKGKRIEMFDVFNLSKEEPKYKNYKDYDEYIVSQVEQLEEELGLTPEEINYIYATLETSKK